jgi:hypothetical protein
MQSEELNRLYKAQWKQCQVQRPTWLWKLRSRFKMQRRRTEEVVLLQQIISEGGKIFKYDPGPRQPCWTVFVRDSERCRVFPRQPVPVVEHHPGTSWLSSWKRSPSIRGASVAYVQYYALFSPQPIQVLLESVRLLLVQLSESQMRTFICYGSP